MRISVVRRTEFLKKKMEDVVLLNVGGVYFFTRRSTLQRSNSFFTGLSNTEETEIFVDRDPTYFRHVMNWMRGVRYVPEDDTVINELIWEADYYCLPGMKEALQKTRAKYSLLRSVSEIANGMRHN